jgi:hypothetical protein
MHLTFNTQAFSSSVLPPPTTSTHSDTANMTIGSLNQNRGTQTSSNTDHAQDFKRSWKPRKHQHHDMKNRMQQNNQSRANGWKTGDKQRMDALRN